MQGIAFLHHRNDRVRLDFAVFLQRHRLVQLGIEGLALRIHGFDMELREAVDEAFQGQVHAFVNRLDGFVFVLASRSGGAFQVVDHHQQFAAEALLAELVRFLDVVLGAAAQVLHFRLGAQRLFLGLAAFLLGFGEASRHGLQGQPMIGFGLIDVCAIIAALADARLECIGWKLFVMPFLAGLRVRLLLPWCGFASVTACCFAQLRFAHVAFNPAKAPIQGNLIWGFGPMFQETPVIQYTAGMLQQLSIQNYATIRNLRVDFHSGMSALTGETGAGKSIIVEALGLVLGDRADKSVLRSGASKAEVAAEFDLSGNAAASGWLEEHQLQGELENSCLIRRAIGRDGRSRAFINDSPVTMANLQQLGELLADIVSQQEHQSLLRRQTQLELLDNFCVERELLDGLRELHRSWQDNQRAIARLRGDADEARAELLAYQLDELQQLAAEDDELESLEREQRRLSGAEQALAALAGALQDLGENEQCNALASLRRSWQLLDCLQGDSERIANALAMIETACIHIGEAEADLRAASDEFAVDPARLAQVDGRLGDLHDMARKHKVKPAELAELTRSLAGQLQQLHGRDEELQGLLQGAAELQERYAALAARVGEQRRAGADTLARAIEEQTARLGMGNASVEIRLAPLDPGTIHARGLEQAEFLVATNPGLAPGPLGKIASGGELSRISLAIRVVTAHTTQTPCLIFDEIDVGIGGAVAAQTGALLRALGGSAQLLCITHQGQVASHAHRQYSISKSVDGENTSTSIDELDEAARVQELARMLGGAAFSEASLAHARQMLAEGQAA